MKNTIKFIMIIMIAVLMLSACGKSPDKNTESVHTHTFSDTVVSATVKDGGYTLHRCTECGYEFKDNYTQKLEWKEVFISYLKQNGEKVQETNERYIVEKKLEGLTSKNIVTISLVYFVKDDEIQVQYKDIFDKQLTEFVNMSFHGVREKYSFDYGYILSENGKNVYSAVGSGYFTAKDVYCLTSLSFDSYFESYKMNWKADQQKSSARLLKSACKAYDEELKNIGLDITYWGIEY